MKNIVLAILLQIAIKAANPTFPKESSPANQCYVWLLASLIAILSHSLRLDAVGQAASVECGVDLRYVLYNAVIVLHIDSIVSCLCDSSQVP